MYIYIYTKISGESTSVCRRSWPVKDECLAAKVAKLHFYICGFRGDWKALRQLFSLSRDYSRNEAGFEETII